MKTQLPNSIESVEQAKEFLNDLHKNGELFHPEDDAHDIDWGVVDQIPTGEERTKLNELMEQCYSFEGFDPCEHCCELLEIA